MNHKAQTKLAIILFLVCTLLGSCAVYQVYETYFFAKAARLELAK
jgi:hypothetical protein